MAGMKELAELVSELEDQLVICVRCGMCQAVCPLFEQTGKEADVARGKLALLDGLVKNLFDGAEGVKERLDRCLLCGSCAANCPSGVRVLEIFIKARAILTEYSGLSPIKKLIFKKILAKPETFDRITQLAGRTQKIFTKEDENFQKTSSAKLISPLIARRHFVPLAEKPFHSLIFPEENSSDINTYCGKSGLKIAFFTGCLIDKFFPQIGKACLDVFKFHGVGVFLPRGQGCCGIPALASGDTDTFEKLVEHNITLFKRENFDYLVTACATCTSTIKKLWPVIYKNKNSGFKNFLTELSDKTLDVNQFMINNCLPAKGKNSNLSIPVYDDDNTRQVQRQIVTYHDPCHLKKSLGISEEPRRLIKASGYELKEMATPDRCCGMGGSFNLFYYDISSQIGDLKQKDIAGTNCSIVATGCPACMMQIADMLAKNNRKIKVKHPIELYAESIKSLNDLNMN